MLRCIKWLPFACIGLFALFCLIGYKLVADKVKAPPPPLVKITINFRAFDVSGREVFTADAVAASNGNHLGRLPQHLQNLPGESDTITVTPEDAQQFRPSSVKVTWLALDKTQYKEWLNAYLDSPQNTAGVHIDGGKWARTVKDLDSSVGDKLYDYPIVLGPK